MAGLNRQRSREGKTKRITLFRCVYSRTKNRAIKRGLEWALDFSQFLTLAKQNCYLCGSKPNNVYKYTSGQKGKVTYSGLDRIDSKKGYTIDNVNPCCRHCNSMKLDQGLDDFKKHIKKISRFSFKISHKG